MANYGISFAVSVIKEEFGLPCSEVAKSLLSYGKQTLNDMRSFTSIDIILIRKSLFSLIHHNVAFFTEEGDKTYYQIVLDNIFLRTLNPKLIQYAKERFGQHGEIVIQELAQNGRLTSENIISYSIYSMKNLPQNAFIDVSFEMGVFKECLNELIQQKFIIRADLSSPAVLPLAYELLEREVDKSNLSKAFRTKESAPGKGGARKSSQSSEQGRGGKKAKTADVRTAPVVSSLLLNSTGVPQTEEKPVEHEIYWRINWDRFLVMFSHIKMAEFCSQKINVFAGVILETILRMSEPTIQSNTDSSSQPLRIEDLSRQLVEENFSEESNLAQYLKVMASDRVPFLYSISSSCVVKRREVMKVLKEKLIESIVTEKFGNAGLRIYNLLLAKKFLSDKMVSELALLPFTMTRQLLFDMMKKNVVHLQEVPKTTDHCPSRTIYLWTVR
eukprot:TRINITY_DN4247_c0_g1_i2.p1 TRINITY_DN4247_c0_g1~~TRINITY_DN4247_c0_g1_i2.p1  ORF type:complete len:443 (-),score=145.63 TRINITY_DN4247_c0_g1_i2:244-1572(-)